MRAWCCSYAAWTRPSFTASGVFSMRAIVSMLPSSLANALCSLSRASLRCFIALATCRQLLHRHGQLNLGCGLIVAGVPRAVNDLSLAAQVVDLGGGGSEKVSDLTGIGRFYP